MKIEYAIIILALCIASSGFWIGNALKQDNVELTTTNDNLSISEDSIKKIIIQEEKH